jgi:CRP/FNR family cyclic AMP-dependent transcriptional regulator
MPAHSDLLAPVPLFALLDATERQLLAERLDEVHFAQGQALFSYGDPGDSLYVIISGEVELFVKNDTGERIVLETARPGDFFGEISLLDQGPRTASAVALSDVRALLVDHGDLAEFFRLRPEAALDMLAATGRRLRESGRRLRHTATRNVNDVEVDNRTIVMKAADWIAEFSGSMPFLFLHVIFFAIWIILNVGLFPFGDFDPFPFGLLTMVVSLEAIILSVFVLLSQNRQTERDRTRNNIEYEVNLKAEMEIAHLHEKMDDLHAKVLARFTHLEKTLNGTRPDRDAAALRPTGGPR